MQVRSGILDLATAMTADPMAELEQRGIELRFRNVDR